MPRVFEAVGLEWTTTLEERIRSWRAVNPKGKRGRHDYTLVEYGLDRATTVSGAFAEKVHGAVRRATSRAWRRG